MKEYLFVLVEKTNLDPLSHAMSMEKEGAASCY